MDVINATPELLEEYYGKVPANTTKAVVVVSDNQPVAISGIMLRNGNMVMYSDISDGLRENKGFKRVIVKSYRKLLALLPDMPVYAHANPEIDGSELLLEHIGFEHQYGDIWRI